MILQPNLINFIKMFEFTELEFCDQALELLTKDTTQWKKENGIETSYLSNTEIEWNITRSLDPIIKNYVYSGNYPWFTQYNGHTMVKFNRIKSNKKMEIRCDHNSVTGDDGQTNNPIFTVIGLLNDDFEGGEFMLIDEPLKFKKGQIVMFPGNFLYPYFITKVTKGTRYSYISWVY